MSDIDRVTEAMSEMSLTELPECLPHEVQFAIPKSVFELSSNQLSDEYIQKNGKRESEDVSIGPFATKSVKDLSQPWTAEFFHEDGEAKTAHEVKLKSDVKVYKDRPFRLMIFPAGTEFVEEKFGRN